MILYNITVVMDDEVEREWLNFVKNTFVPQVLATNFFVSNRLLRVIDSPNEGITYCMQFVAENMQDYSKFKMEHEGDMLNAHASLFKDKSVFFNSLMEFVD